jgi:hypothetical protein
MKRHEENIKDVAPAERVSTMLRPRRRRDSMKTLGIPVHDSEISSSEHGDPELGK